MSFLARLSIRKQLIAAFSLLGVIMLLLGVFAISQLTAVSTLSADIANNSLPSVKFTGGIAADVNEYRATVLRHILTTDDKDMAAVEAKLGEILKRFNDQRAGYEPLITAGFERNLYTEFSKSWDAYRAQIEEVLKLSRLNKNEEARDLSNSKAAPLYEQAQAALDKLVAFNADEGDRNGERADATAALAFKLIAGLLIGAVLLQSAITVLIVRGVNSGISSVVKPMQALSQGDLTVEVPSRGEKTEIGTIADAVQVFKEALVEKKRLDGLAAVEAEAKAKRAKTLDELTQGFESKVGALVQALSSASTELEATAQSMSGTAEETNQQAMVVAASAEQTSANVQTVATATEELSSSIQEIGRQVEGSSRSAAQAVEEAKRTDATVQALAESAQKIGEVVSLITDIAAQTNLLALNATIEAARAGEAGKGFAVVASEVKNLANQTARATEEIGSQIGQIQSTTKDAVAAIQAITATIEEMSHTTAAIAAAVEQQGAATQEIAGNVQQASQGTQEVSGNIGQVREAATTTGASANQVLSAAAELARHSSDLRAEVGHYIDGVKAA